MFEIIRSLPKPFILIDGPCGSGKSTLATHLHRLYPELNLVHMDDFYIPVPQKTPERLAVPGGNANLERLWEEVVSPYLLGQPALVRPYNAHKDCYLPGYTLDPEEGIIIEGSYSCLPQLAEHAHLKLFVQVDPATQRERIRLRNPDTFPLFESRWIPLENAYFSYYHMPDGTFTVIDGNKIHDLF